MPIDFPWLGHTKLKDTPLALDNTEKVKREMGSINDDYELKGELKQVAVNIKDANQGASLLLRT